MINGTLVAMFKACVSTSECKLRSVNRLNVLQDWLMQMVHPSAHADEILKTKHVLFLRGHLLAGLAALMAFPVCLAFFGVPSTPVAMAFLLLCYPLPLALYLSKTGRLQSAIVMSVFAFVALVIWVAAFTGGLTSGVLVWLLVVPLEAVMSVRRRNVVMATVSVLVGLATLATLTWTKQLPPSMIAADMAPFLFWASLSVAVLYAADLAIRFEAFQKRGVRQARRNLARYRLLADNVSDVVTGHLGNGDVVYASSAIERLAGVKASDMLEDGLFRRVHIADRPAYLNTISEAKRCNKVVTVEFRLMQAFGDYAKANPDYIWVEMSCIPVAREEWRDEGIEVIAATRDISAHKAYEEELLSARLDAEAASDAKTQFLANMSHELRTPLNAIIGFSEILGQEIFGKLENDQQKEYVKLIHESGEHLLQVVNDILDMSKIESGKFAIVREPFDVNSVVANCTSMLTHQAAENQIALTTDLADDLPELNADRRACKQILINLLSNAIKFTDKGGAVQLSVTTTDQIMSFAVDDNGIGIGEDDIDRLGNPFVQAESSYDRKYEGTGLGLSVVRGLIELHGGRLVITSELGVGTCVTAMIPLHEGCDLRNMPELEKTAKTVHTLKPVGTSSASGTGTHPGERQDVTSEHLEATA